MIHMIIGPPGTGKTTALMNILEIKLETIPSSRIAFCTYTKEGANQGVTRALEKFKLKKDDFPYFRTLHSLAFKELSMTGDKLVTPQRYREFGLLMGRKF